MHTGNKLPLIKENLLMTKAIIEMTKKRLGCLGVTNNNNRLIGIITDGQIRRSNQKNNDLKKLLVT